MGDRERITVHDKDYFDRLPPAERRSERLVQIARLETALMVEFLADDRPDWREATWIRNCPPGPSPAGIETVRRIQERFGSCHVTTGNPQPLSPNEVGIYVRTDVLGSEPSLLRRYLS